LVRTFGPRGFDAEFTCTIFLLEGGYRQHTVCDAPREMWSGERSSARTHARTVQGSG
jgi:hypothetical protein